MERELQFRRGVRVFVLVVASALILALPGYAQGGRRTDALLYSRPVLPTYLGIEGGYARWKNQADFSVSDRNIPCATFTDGEGEGPVGGVKGIIYFTRWFILSPRIRYEARSGTFVSPLPGEPARNASNEIVTLDEEAQVDVTMATFSIDLMAGIDIARTGIYLAAGPSIGFLANGFYDYTERLNGPSGFSFPGTGLNEQQLVGGRSFDTYNSFVFDLRGAAGYLLRIGRWGLNPEVFYSYPLTSALTSPDLMKQTGVVGTFGILYNFGN